jgi:hypothetical protein
MMDGSFMRTINGISSVLSVDGVKRVFGGTVAVDGISFEVGPDEIVGLLGEGKTAAAADVADAKLGLMAMGRHRGAPADASPGRHMPDAMHQQGRNLHIVANDFAKAARSGDLAKALVALQPVTGTCVSCHASYRIR